MDFSKVTALQIPEGNVTKIEDKEGKVLWANINKVAYGIRWTTSTNTACERIGNLEYHKTLPIQSKFKVCVHQNKDIQYYCNPDDSRFRENPTILSKEQFVITSCDGLPTGVVSCDENSNVKYCCINDIFADYKYLYAYICVRTESDSCVARIVHVDTTTKTAYLNDYNQHNSNYVDNTCDISNIVNTDVDYTVELGTVINGYDGEIGVDTGAKFYQWSVDNEGNGNEVWISEYKCVPYAKEVKRHIVGHNRACVLRTVFNDDKWGWIGTLQSNTAVNVINYNSRLRGGNNPDNFDQYLGVDNFRTQLGKACTSQSLASMRQFTQKLPSHQVLYKQIWEALVWCWCIEYAELDVKKAFNASLTSDGYHQGGLGDGMININDYTNYCNNCNLTQSDYTLHLGNNTGIVNRPARTFTIQVAANAYWNRYYLSRVTQTIDSSNKIMTITAIPKAYPNDWNMYAKGTVVCGTVRYTVSGLTDGQTIIFKKPDGNLIVVEDGTYDIDWGTANSNRFIAFSKSQAECNIVLTIESAPGGNLVNNQIAWQVPHWRGFNVFFYGDNWINIENFLSKYDNTKRKRIYYWTDDVTKFDNNIDNKEHQIEDGGNCQINFVKEFVLGTQGAMIPRSYGDGKKVFHLDNYDTSIHGAFAGGDFSFGSFCGLGFLGSMGDVGHAASNFGFFTTTILD